MCNDQITAELRLDLVDSSGQESQKIIVATARLMAFSLEAGGMWYGFIITKAPEDEIIPGNTVRVTLAFLDALAAKRAFPPGASAIFGNGVLSRGFFRLIAD